MSKAKDDGLSPAIHTAIGGFAGIVEVCIMQPTVAIKNALQEGRPLPANPAAYYRGLLVNGGSVAPITAIQFGVHRTLENALRASNNGRLDRNLQIIAGDADFLPYHPEFCKAFFQDLFTRFMDAAMMISAKDIIEGLTHVSHFCQGDHLKDFYNRNGYVQGVSLYFGETSHYMAYISLFCDATIMKRWQKCTGVAGSSSSLLGCPAELIMIQQQKSGRGLIQEASQYVSKFGARQLYRGLMTTATRDGIYTASYLGISPALQAYLDESPSFQNLPHTARFFAAAIATGSLAAVVTQPVDTIKTRMQAFPDKERMPEYTSIRSTAKLLIQANGVLSLWTGLMPRLVRLSGATIILQVVRNQMIALLEGENEGN